MFNEYTVMFNKFSVGLQRRISGESIERAVIIAAEDLGLKAIPRHKVTNRGEAPLFKTPEPIFVNLGTIYEYSKIRVSGRFLPLFDIKYDQIREQKYIELDNFWARDKQIKSFLRKFGKQAFRLTSHTNSDY